MYPHTDPNNHTHRLCKCTMSVPNHNNKITVFALTVLKVKRHSFCCKKHIPKEGPRKWKLSFIPILLNVYSKTSFDL